MQALGCADSGASLISPFVGRILDWYKAKEGRDFAPEEDPGVLSVRRIYWYYKRHGVTTDVMGASFRNVGEVQQLAGCDKLTVAPALLGELAKLDGDLPRLLSPEAAEENCKDEVRASRCVLCVLRTLRAVSPHRSLASPCGAGVRSTGRNVFSRCGSQDSVSCIEGRRPCVLCALLRVLPCRCAVLVEGDSERSHASHTAAPPLSTQACQRRACTAPWSGAGSASRSLCPSTR